MRRSLLPLRSLGLADSAWAGNKAATLGPLLRAGYPVPDGFAVGETATRSEVEGALAALGDVPVAARSSAVAEDAADASFAGQFDTLLGLRGVDAVWQAVELVRASAANPRARAYRRGGAGAMGVLVQRMVEASVAGVAFTADPLSGERGVTIVSGVRGLGERLVSGAADADEWIVREGAPPERRRGSAALDPRLAAAVAELARRVERERGAPQDIEWAWDGTRLWLLQTRPLTALLDARIWDPPLPGAWARSFRLGEWIADPVTPLFESWALTAIEERMHRFYADLVGVQAEPPLHLVVNGWYYYSLNFLPASPGQIVRLLPTVVPRLVRSFRRVAPAFPPIARFGIALYEREWRAELLPRYRAAVTHAESEVTALPVDRLPTLVDELLALAGEYFASLTIVAGYGWKSELPLAQLYRRHLASVIGGSHLDLLAGLGRPILRPHAVACLDWCHPTLGERGGGASDEHAGARLARLEARRHGAEARARAALAATPKRLARFEELVREAQRAALVREEHIAEFTLPWPVLRRALARIGAELASRGVVASAEDVHYLRRDELPDMLADATDLRTTIARRRVDRERLARLAAPLVIGRLPKMLERMLHAADEILRGPAVADAVVQGVPASGGSATGIARVLRSPEEGERLAVGEVLVAPATAPAWTPLFTRAAAVVTDVGGAAAHASIVAREYGIPAVVGCGDATVRIRDGDRVTVDGSRGVVLEVVQP